MDLFFGNGAGWFAVPAFVGTFFFVLRLILMLVGGDSDMDTDFDAELHGGDAHVGDHGDADASFKLLSVQSIAAFMMGFGWGGLGGLRGAGWDATSSVAFGAVFGVGMVWILGKLFQMMYRLQSSGNVSIQDALGTEGNVYIRIPPSREGRGKVRLVIGDQQVYYNAVTDYEALESNTVVRITDVNDDNTVTVSKP